jgi:hypothetical protein
MGEVVADITLACGQRLERLLLCWCDLIIENMGEVVFFFYDHSMELEVKELC